MAEISWQFFVDWDNDGDFSESLEDISSYVRGPTGWSLGMKQPWQRLADEAETTWTVLNGDGRFSPENGSSPYAGSLVPRRLMRVQSVYQGGTTVHWQGYLNTVRPVPGEYGRRLATLEGLGPKQFLQGTEVFLDLLEDVTADTAIDDILDQVDTGFARSLEAGRTRLAYVGDTWADGIDAYRAIESLVKAEQGALFMARSGTTVFWNRHHLLKTRAVGGTVAGWLAMDYRYGEDMVNRVGVQVRPRKISSTATETLWTLDEPVTIQPGKSRTWRCRYADDSGAEIAGRDVVQPSTGAGTLVYTGGVATVSAFDAQARSAELTLSNSSSYAVTVTTLVIQGKKLTSWNTQTVFEEDAASLAAYGKRELIIDAELLDSEAQGRTVAKYALGRRGVLAGIIPRLTMTRRTAALEALMLGMTLGDRIRVSDSKTGHDGEHFILGEEHRLIDGSLRQYEVTWTLEPADARQYFIIGTSKVGGDDRVGY